VKIPEKTPEKKEVKAEQKPAALEQVEETLVTKTTRPLSRPGISSGFSINSFLNKEDKVETTEDVVVKTEHLPQNHFTDTDLQMEWKIMLKQLQVKNNFVFNAVKTFKLEKAAENKIKVLFPSDSAKVEFDKISGEFFNHFKRKIQNHRIEVEYVRDVENLKIEVVTKRKMFEKMIEKNPLLKDLDDLMKFDLT
jgi:DNA polymerase-3 subunit gamma/tau